MTDYLTVQEVAERMRCEHRTVRRAIKTGELDAALIGGKWLIREEAVEAWFESRKASSGRVPGGTPARVRRDASRIRANQADRPGSVARLQAIEGSKR